jgi:hypothetical protein
MRVSTHIRWNVRIARRPAANAAGRYTTDLYLPNFPPATASCAALLHSTLA